MTAATVFFLANTFAVLGWLMLVGWVHHLAFDLFVGAWIARRTEEVGLPRRILSPLLPMTVRFGPAGLIAFLVVTPTTGRRLAPAAARGALP